MNGESTCHYIRNLSVQMLKPVRTMLKYQPLNNNCSCFRKPQWIGNDQSADGEKIEGVRNELLLKSEIADLRAADVKEEP